MYVCMCVCMYVCNLSPPKRLDRLSTSVPHYLRLGQGKVLGQKNSGSIHRFAGNPGKTGFYSSLYITLYYRNRMSSICETAKPIDLKFCGKLLLGPGMVLG